MNLTLKSTFENFKINLSPSADKSMKKCWNFKICLFLIFYLIKYWQYLRPRPFAILVRWLGGDYII